MDRPEPTVRIVERGLRESSFGRVMQLKVWADGHPDLRWEEIQAAFNDAYPHRYAVQLFPPRETIVNGKACYHLWILPEPPRGLDLREGEGGFARRSGGPAAALTAGDGRMARRTAVRAPATPEAASVRGSQESP